MERLFTDVKSFFKRMNAMLELIRLFFYSLNSYSDYILLRT